MENKIPTIKENNIEKPPVLYHGSPNKNISVFTPRSAEFEGEKDKFFFTSPNKAAALAYLAQGDYPWNSGIYLDDNIIRSVLPITREEFIEKDKGGALYSFDSQNFSSSKGRSGYEWVSKESVEPDSKEEFNSALLAMESAGIKMYFLGSRENFEKFRSLKNSSERLEFLKSFEK